MSVFSPCSCYEVRRASATVKIQVIDDTEEPPPSLEVVVCTRYPCTETTPQRRFNKNEKVVLQANGDDNMNMKIQKWESNAAITDIVPDTRNPPPTVTVTLLEAMPEFARQSDPYTFTVTAKFDDGRTNKASTTLYINYVRL